MGSQALSDSFNKDNCIHNICVHVATAAAPCRFVSMHSTRHHSFVFGSKHSVVSRYLCPSCPPNTYIFPPTLAACTTEARDHTNAHDQGKGAKTLVYRATLARREHGRERSPGHGIGRKNLQAMQANWVNKGVDGGRCARRFEGTLLRAIPLPRRGT